MVVAIAGVVAVSLGATRAQARKAATFNLKLSTDLVPGVPYNDAILNGFAPAVSSDTGGDVNVTMYPSNQLYKDQTQALAAAQRGQIDLVITNNLHAESIIPGLDGPSLAYVAPTIAQYYKAMANGTPYFKAIEKEANSAGLEIVPVGASSPGTGGVAFAGSPRTSFRALTGRKIRVPGAGLLADELSSLGGQPVVLSTTQVAPAMSSGAVSAAVATASFVGTTLKGIAGGYLDSGTFQVGPYYFFASKQVWDSLTQADRNGIAKAAKTIVNGWLSKITAQQAAADQALVKQGMWVTHQTPAEAKYLEARFEKSVWPEFQKEDPAAYAALQATRKQLGIK